MGSCLLAKVKLNIFAEKYISLMDCSAKVMNEYGFTVVENYFAESKSLALNQCCSAAMPAPSNVYPYRFYTEKYSLMCTIPAPCRSPLR